MFKNIHLLKIQEKFYMSILTWDKKFEIRLNDRDYQVGDYLKFTCICDDGSSYATDELYEITYMLSSKDFPLGIKENYVILSIRETGGTL